jgi:hypothetical protein
MLTLPILGIAVLLSYSHKVKEYPHVKGV